MNELTRLAYLDALGIDAYVSRSQLGGAAPTRRLAIVSAVSPVATGDASGAADQGTGISPDRVPPDRVPPDRVPPDRVPPDLAQPRSSGAVQLPQIDTAPVVSAPAATVATPRQQATVPRFSLAAIVAGDWLWLEELQGTPLATEQVQLVKAMAHALSEVADHADKAASGQERSGQARSSGARPSGARPEVTQFDWPIHTNQQLDIGEEAARASIAGFIGRKLEQHQCRGLVLLGQSCKARVPMEQLEVLTVSTAGSAELLVDGRLKKQAWRDLLPLVKR